MACLEVKRRGGRMGHRSIRSYVADGVSLGYNASIGVNPMDHIVRRGARKGRIPYPLFSLLASADDSTTRSTGLTSDRQN